MYNIGDEVYFKIYDPKTMTIPIQIMKSKINEIAINNKGIKYHLVGGYIKWESNVFKTKQEILDVCVQEYTNKIRNCIDVI